MLVGPHRGTPYPHPMSTTPFTVFVAAGGTGGDLFPAVAVVQELQRRHHADVVLFGNPSRMEARVAPEHGYEFVPISVRGYKGLRSLQSYLLPLTILHSLLRVSRFIRRRSPRLVICAGTYISFPVALAARLHGIPVVSIESNVLPGKANRLVARFASLIIAAFDETRAYLPASTHAALRVVGNPLRSAFRELPSRATAAASFGFDHERPTILVFGGSLGARSLNMAMSAALPQFQRENVQVIWQTGRDFSAPAQVPDNVRVVTFINDMASAYAACDVVVCRAGGGTVAELTVVAKPAILVPYPHAANNEQEFNARALESKGGAVMIKDADVKGSMLDVMLGLVRDEERRNAMRSALRAMSRPDAARDAVDEIEKLVSFT